MEHLILDPLPGAKDERVSRPQRGGPVPNRRAITYWGQYLTFGERLQGAVGLPLLEQLQVWPALVGPSQTGRPFHPMLLTRPYLEPQTPCAMCTQRKAMCCRQIGSYGWTWGTEHA